MFKIQQFHQIILLKTESIRIFDATTVNINPPVNATPQE